MATLNAQDFSLREFEDRGFSGPFQIISPEDAAEAYQKFFAVLGQSPENPQPATVQELGGWHFQHRWAYELATHPSVVAAMREILGDDLILWAMRFWYKEPNSKAFIPWHQDIRYWPMEPAINASAWITLGPSVRENGCLRFIPGTHKKDYGHVTLEGGDAHLKEAVDPSEITESDAIDMEMRPGEGVFFSERIFHSSDANRAAFPRVAFSVRYTTPEVRFSDDANWEDTGARTILVSGQDRFHHNDRLAFDIPAEWRSSS